MRKRKQLYPTYQAADAFGLSLVLFRKIGDAVGFNVRAPMWGKLTSPETAILKPNLMKAIREKSKNY